MDGTLQKHTGQAAAQALDASGYAQGDGEGNTDCLNTQKEKKI